MITSPPRSLFQHGARIPGRAPWANCAGHRGDIDAMETRSTACHDRADHATPLRAPNDALAPPGPAGRAVRAVRGLVHDDGGAARRLTREPRADAREPSAVARADPPGGA